MARQAKETVPAQKVAKEDIQRVIREATQQKQRASEYQSSVGGFIKGQIERFELDRTAFNWTLRLNNMEPTRKQAVLREFLDYSLKAGHFDQVDMFDDMGGTLEEILALIRANDRRNSPTTDEAVEELAN